MLDGTVEVRVLGTCEVVVVEVLVVGSGDVVDVLVVTTGVPCAAMSTPSGL